MMNGREGGRGGKVEREGEGEGWLKIRGRRVESCIVIEGKGEGEGQETEGGGSGCMVITSVCYGGIQEQKVSR